MTQQNESFNPFDPMGLMKDMRNTNLDSWAKMMSQVVHTEAYSEATAKMLDTWLTSSGPFRKAMENSMSQTLGSLNMPSREDVLRLAERLTNIEMRLDDMDAKLDEVLRHMAKATSSS